MIESITREECELQIQIWNQIIDDFMEYDLPLFCAMRGVEVVNGHICMNDWFRVQTIINEQEFYKRGRVVQKRLREYGYDVKMNMQTHKLTLY